MSFSIDNMRDALSAAGVGKRRTEAAAETQGTVDKPVNVGFRIEKKVGAATIYASGDISKAEDAKAAIKDAASRLKGA